MLHLQQVGEQFHVEALVLQCSSLGSVIAATVDARPAWAFIMSGPIADKLVPRLVGAVHTAPWRRGFRPRGRSVVPRGARLQQRRAPPGPAPVVATPHGQRRGGHNAAAAGSARSHPRRDKAHGGRGSLTPEKAARREFLLSRTKDARTRKAELRKVVSELRGSCLFTSAQDYTVVIGALGKTNLLNLALDLLVDMRESNYPANVITYTAAISACEKGGHWLLALDLLDELRVQAANPNVVTYNAAIGACGKGQEWEAALALFGELVVQPAVVPTEVTYCALISACKHGGQWQHALLVKDEMLRRDVRGNVVTWGSVIHACEKCSSPGHALQLFGEMKQVGFQPDHMLYNVLLRACERLAFWKRAMFFMQKMQEDGYVPDSVDYRSAIACCTQARQWQRAVLLFEEMKAKGIRANADMYAAVILAYQHGGNAKLALDLLEEARRQKALSTGVFTAAMQACQRLGQPDLQCQLWEELKRLRNLDLDETAYSSAIEAYVACGREELAMELALEMRRRSLKPSGSACVACIQGCLAAKRAPVDEEVLKWLYSSAIWGYTAEQQSSQALRSFTNMRQQAVEPDAACYAAAICACEDSPKDASSYAKQLLVEMRGRRLQPSVAAYEATMRMSSGPEVLGLLADMREQDLQPAVRALSLGLAACADGAAWEEALQLLAEAEGRGMPLGAGSLQAAIHACEASGRHDCAAWLHKRELQAARPGARARATASASGGAEQRPGAQEALGRQPRQPKADDGRLLEGNGVGTTSWRSRGPAWPGSGARGRSRRGPAEEDREEEDDREGEAEDFGGAVEDDISLQGVTVRPPSSTGRLEKDPRESRQGMRVTYF